MAGRHALWATTPRRMCADFRPVRGLLDVQFINRLDVVRPYVLRHLGTVVISTKGEL